MKCPKCKKLMGVTNTYSGDQLPAKLKYITNSIAQVTNPDQLVIRARKCRDCGQYYYTVEILDQPIKINQGMRATLKEKFKK